MVDVIGFTGVSALMSSISYTSGARMMYFFPSANYPPVIPFKRKPTKLPRTGASKGAKRARPSYTKIYFLVFCNVLGFTSSQILSQFLLFFYLLIIHFNISVMVHSQIALIVSGFKCFMILFSVLWKNNVTLST